MQAPIPAWAPVSADELAASRALCRLIADDIRGAGGQVSFARFMELALYAPGHGYYSAGQRKLGAGGDFVTGPELTPMFGQCLARVYTEVQQALGQADLLEVGGGSGKLALDVLLALEQTKQLPRHYYLLEVSAELRSRQRQTLSAYPALYARVRWLDTLPENFRGLIVGNEVLDAMPVDRFVMQADGAHLLGVGVDGEAFAWRHGPRDAALSARLAPLALPVGYTSEVGRIAEGWLRSMGERLAAGVLLLIDYGFPRAEFYHPDRHTGTLMCHHRQRAHADPLVLVGLQDITAHIDFTAMAEAGRDVGLSLAGYTSQAAFLLGSGLTEIAAQSDPADTRAHLARMQAVKKLTLPHEMGELFKAIGFSKGVELALPGFALQDRRHRL